MEFGRCGEVFPVVPQPVEMVMNYANALVQIRLLDMMATFVQESPSTLGNV